MLAVYLLALLIPFVLYHFRSMDDNRLTSWRFVFSVVPFTRFLFAFVPALLAAYILSVQSFFLTAGR